MVSTIESDRESTATTTTTEVFDGMKFEILNSGRSAYPYAQQEQTTISTQAATHVNPALTGAGEGDFAEDSHVKDSTLATGPRSRSSDNKYPDLSILKTAIHSGSPHLFMLHIKSGMDNNGAQELGTLHDPTIESDWTGVAVGSGNEQPISPLVTSRPSMVRPPTIPTHSRPNTTTEYVLARPQILPPSTPEHATPTVPISPRRDCEKWTPPLPQLPRERRSQDVQQQQQTLRQPHSGAPIPRLLKQRSFNFLNNGPASTDGSFRPAAAEACADNNPTQAGSSSDGPRPVGPPDPIPPHYQHLQNRHSRRPSSFCRRSQGVEPERFTAGWIVTESAPGSPSDQPTPRTSISDDNSSSANQGRPSTPGRHASMGPHPASRWGRLLTSILPLGSGSDSGDRDGAGDPYLHQQRLLLATSSQSPQATPYQQQLFFYADEVFEELGWTDSSDNGFSQDDEFVARRRYSSEGSSDREDAPSFFNPSAMVADESLQGELAHEDRRDSIEYMDAQESMFVPSQQQQQQQQQQSRDGFVVPRTLSVDGKIPVSCLALSSPPSYWEATIKYQGWPKIEPRPENGQEFLPRYTCSVFREGCVNRKTELIGNWRPYRRPWK
ncbi:hypothetical protein BGZ54_006184 [Gamsiella multidivaricata]|nr:hypothetical protein BGZ54_006184 [Gamsiella multidivaricata]